jgi:phage/plasmid-like protein (TIGR03299 family)
MAHEIDTTTGQAAVFVTGTPAWHGLGTVVSEAQTSSEAIKLARLDWTVEQLPIYTRHQGVERAVAERVANVRSDSGAVLGVVSPGYKPFQNAAAFEFFDAVVQEKLAVFESAGALKGGRHVWMLARLPRTVQAAAGDTVLPYVLLANAHDGSRALRMVPTTVRVVCANTLNLALGKAGSDGLVVYHSESLERRVKEAREKLGIIVGRVDRFEEEVQTLARRQLSQEQLTAYFVSLVKDRSERQQKQLLERFAANFDGETNTLPSVRGSLWAAYNAVSEYADHQATVRGKDAHQRADGRLYSAWFGSGANMKQQAYEAALALVA